MNDQDQQQRDREAFEKWFSLELDQSWERRLATQGVFYAALAYARRPEPAEPTEKENK